VSSPYIHLTTTYHKEMHTTNTHIIFLVFSPYQSPALSHPFAPSPLQSLFPQPHVQRRTLMLMSMIKVVTGTCTAPLDPMSVACCVISWHDVHRSSERAFLVRSRMHGRSLSMTFGKSIKPASEWMRPWKRTNGLHCRAY